MAAIPSQPRARYDRPAIVALILLAAAIALRAVQFGNPVIQIDEQFYLMVGDRMLAGDLPYVDHWDRKPFGLFALYAAMRSLGGDGVLAYQLVATLFAGATALVIQRIARRIAPPVPSILAAILYLVLLMANGGDGGQSPVFYNLPMALACLLLLRTSQRAAFDWRAGMEASAAMALVGLALQIKYSAIFEGVYFGIAFLVIAWRGGLALPRIAALGLFWIALALLPTAAVSIFYAATGHWQDFVFQNFTSIFLRSPYPEGGVLPRLIRILVHIAPVLVAAIAGVFLVRRGPAPARPILLAWAGVAVLALIVFGTYHPHYALPLLPPLAVLAAPAFARWRRGAALVLVASAVLAWVTVRDTRKSRGTGPEARAIASRIEAVPDATLFVFSGDPILYTLTGIAPPTRLSFPTLLSERRDMGTTGVDEHRELARVLAEKPQFIVSRNHPFREADPVAWAMMDHALGDYRLAMSQKIGSRTILLYERRSGLSD